MKKIDDTLSSPAWIKIAGKDLKRVERMLEDDDVEAAAFFLQQSLEKYLKAFLLQKGWELKKIHTLYTLLDDAVNYQPELEAFRDLCEQVSGYYFIERYPGFTDTDLTKEDIEQNLEYAKRLIKIILDELTGGLKREL